jgi:hypothetical protein
VLKRESLSRIVLDVDLLKLQLTSGGTESFDELDLTGHDLRLVLQTLSFREVFSSERPMRCWEVDGCKVKFGFGFL